MRGGGRMVDDEGREIEGGGKGYRFVTSFFLSFYQKKKGFDLSDPNHNI